MDNELIEPEHVNLCKDCPDEDPVPSVPEYGAAGRGLNAGADQIKWKMDWRIDKYDGEVTSEQIAAGEVTPVETVHVEGNLAMNAGIQRILDFLIGAVSNAGANAFDATHSRIGAGNSSTAAVASQTDLQGASKYFKLCSSASRSSQTVTWAATFGTGVGNFAWNEMCIDNGTADGATVTAPMLNRKVVSLGTKTSAQTWAATGTLTLA